MKPLFYFLLTLLSVTSIAAQDYEKDESSYVEYEGNPSKAFQALYGKSTTRATYGFNGRVKKSFPPNVIKIGVLEILQGRPMLFYERALIKGLSLEVGIGVNFKPFAGFANNGAFDHNNFVIRYTENGEEEVNLYGPYKMDNTKRNLGFHYSISPRYYFNGRAPKGFYISPGITHTFAKFTTTFTSEYGSPQFFDFQRKEKSTEFGIGGGVGGQFIIKSTVVLDLNFMVYYNYIMQERYSLVDGEYYTIKGTTPQVLYSIKLGGLWGNKKSKS